MVEAVKWWVLVTIVGWAVLPAARRLLRFLPDEGYTFARPLGLLLSAYLLWAGCSLGFLLNTAGNAFFVVAAIAALCWGAGYRWGWREYIRRNARLILATEALFALGFFAFARFRAFSPEIMGTEKPMEFAFLNAILRSRTFPPHDPWLAGFAVSYYYFGYVMVALLTRLAGTAPGVAFNLGIALLFALTLTGAFGLGYNLVRKAQPSPQRAIRYGLLAALFVALMGNLEGPFELLRCKGGGSPAFWQSLDIKGIEYASPCPNSWHPVDHWWWWRASRVVRDRNLLGQDQEVIDEFPFFSFLLGDMHPHVLGLPFVLLATAMALSAFAGAGEGAPLRRDKTRLAGYALALGGLAFLNTWDFPIYLALTAAACGLAHFRRGAGLWESVEEAAYTGVILGLGGVLLYAPFYVGFRSQAGGILPVLFNATKIHHYLIMFGVFVFIIALFLLREFPALHLRASGCALWGVVAGAFLFAGGCLLLRRPLPALLTPFILGSAGIALSRDEEPGRGAHAFAALLMLSGLLLTLAVEFVYIKDSFGTRMNTVFKFYYQAWVQMAVASAFGVYALWEGKRRLPRVPGVLAGAFLAVLVGAGLYYTVAASATRVFLEKPVPHPTLDGTAYLAEHRPADYRAIRWLNENVKGAPVILEATGGSYSEYAFVSAFTGLPTVLGWDFHELQWRGSFDEPARRRPDIERIYTTYDANEAAALLDKYGVEYVYLGPLERRAYKPAPPAVSKFYRFMSPVYTSSDVLIFRR